MSGLVDRHRRFHVGGLPVATGIAAVGDACVCTNPTNGRGMSLGMMHVQRLRDVIRAHLNEPREFAEVWDAVTEAELTPWYRENLEEDRARMGQMDALRRGLEPEAPTPAAALRQALFAAAPRDPDAFRALLASRCCLTPLRQALADPGFVEHILGLTADRDAPPPTGPDRTQLLRLLDALPTAA
jgi:2-polyprenyl-6-methoxyphenol hydroxylase-like FAD-dependent oxidoreductase